MGNYKQSIEKCKFIKLKRPFLEFSNEELLEKALEKLEANNCDLEVATLIYDELKLRKSIKSKKCLEKVKLAFDKTGHIPIPWLKSARERIGDWVKIKTNNTFISSVYIILKDGYTTKNQRYGVYVGETSKSVEERFKEHKSGIRSGRGLQKNGIQIMRSLFTINKIKKKKDRKYYESAINETLKTVGIKVSGDVLDEMKYPYTKWPDDFGHTDLKLKLIEWYEKN